MLKVFKVGNRRRGVIKMITSVLFLSAGIYGCTQRGGNLDIMLVVGLFFASLGDLFLVFMDKHCWFVAGVVSFSAASLTLSIYSIINYQWYWWSLLLFAALETNNIIMQKKKICNYGKHTVLLNIYTLLIFTCGSLGFTLLCQGTTSLSMFLFGLGCFMYFASDVCLGLYMFGLHNRAMDAINSALYFPGMALIAISLLV